MIIQESHTDLKTPTGAMRTFIYEPVETGKYPGLVFFSEIFQQTGPIKRVAQILAGHGYVVAVPEIYHEYEPAGTALAYDKIGVDRGNELKITKSVSAYDDDARACIAYLMSHMRCSGKLGTIGICIGGHLAYRCAMNLEISAAACFYATDIHKGSLGQGQNDNSLERTREIKGELLMIWGKQDPHIPGEGRAKIYQRLNEVEANFTWHEFNAQHAFMRDEGNRYDPELASICYQMVFALFKRRLG